MKRDEKIREIFDTFSSYFNGDDYSVSSRREPERYDVVVSEKAPRNRRSSVAVCFNDRFVHPFDGPDVVLAAMQCCEAVEYGMKN